ncbi:Protein NRT1/ PTR FAMILY 5.6 [Bienertia sinuspersici]
MDTQQNGGSIYEYYTTIKGLWEEEDAMNVLPPITNVTPEIDGFIGALNTQKAEKRLFQFLNGVDEDYASMRTQMLMKTPLPTVEEACASIQQEEMQNEYEGGCTACGGKGHTKERCWTGLGTFTMIQYIPTLKPCIRTSNSCDQVSKVHKVVFFVAAYLIALATGGYKPCLESFGADQFDDNHVKERKQKNVIFQLVEHCSW